MLSTALKKGNKHHILFAGDKNRH